MVEVKKDKGPGRGWHGDSSGHAKAGRLGGKSKSKKKNSK